MGSLYVAEQLSTGNQRALKLMHLSLARGEEPKRRFEQEAKIAARIPSEHVVQVVAAGIDDELGLPWLAMELLEGRDLEERVHRSGPLGPSELLEVYAQLCHALTAAHRQQIVHRDLKPENVFLAKAHRADAAFTVKVLDFGIAKIVADQSSVTQIVGTPLYMAPEQFLGKHISPRTDLWALGLIAFFLLTGECYWRTPRDPSASVADLVREIRELPMEPASTRAASFGKTLPPGFDDWFARAAQRDPERRYADAETLYAALCGALATPVQRTSTLAAAATVPAPLPAMPVAFAPAPTVLATERGAPPSASARAGSDRAGHGADVALRASRGTLGCRRRRVRAVGGLVRAPHPPACTPRGRSAGRARPGGRRPGARTQLAERAVRGRDPAHGEPEHGRHQARLLDARPGLARRGRSREGSRRARAGDRAERQRPFRGGGPRAERFPRLDELHRDTRAGLAVSIRPEILDREGPVRLRGAVTAMVETTRP
jgi:Protein kinase domain